jgi:hypothetical protein
MDGAILRSILSEWISEEYEIESVSKLEPDSSHDTSRNEYLEKYKNRLEKILSLPSPPPKIVSDHERTIRILEDLENEEPIYLWEAKTKEREISGLCCSRGIVAFYGPTNA